MADKLPFTVTYDTREESNQNLGIGLGCNGVIDVLIEPLDVSDENNAAAFFERMISTNSPLALATVFVDDSGLAGRKILVTPEETRWDELPDSQLKQFVVHDLRLLFDSKLSEAKKYTIEGKETEVFIELLQPSISLIVFGGGFDARPVSHLAKSLGWDVTVTDECVAHIAPLFFPTADKLSLCQRSFIDRDFDITPYTACVLMSHNYEYDRDVLRKLIKTPTPFIGILGPRKRFDKMLTEFDAAGIEFSGEDLRRVHSPIGLDIGAEAPDEIALSIVAEIQSKFANRSGGFLKYRNAPIHHRDGKSDQVFKQVYLGGYEAKVSGSMGSGK